MKIWMILSILSCSTLASLAFTFSASKCSFSKGLSNSSLKPENQKNVKRMNTRLSSLKSVSNINQDDIDEIKKMRVKDLKAELIKRKIYIDDVFEKEELVKLLCNARAEKKETESNLKTSETKMENQTKDSKMDSCEISMTFFSLQGNKSVPAKNGNVFLRPSPGQFPAVEFQVPNSPSGEKSSNWKTITLLVDTACSGIVLRPVTVRNLQLQTFDTPMTMTAAGGTNAGGGVSQLPNLQLRTTKNSLHYIKGPFPAAVQDIGALPKGIDGIIGLSFLSRYKTVDFNFLDSSLSLIKSNTLDVSTHLTVVAEASMQLTNMGIYIAEILLDGRGPVKMIVDTGAASTLLNWKGVSDMGLSKSSPQINPNNDQIGAMGADNVALSLTHSFVLKRRFNFQQETGKNTVGVRTESAVKIDIGNLPVLDALQNYGVGGILGSDLLMKCDLLRLTDMMGVKPGIALYQK